MMPSMDSSSLMLLLIGKDNYLLPYIMIALFICKQWSSIKDYLQKILLLGKAQYQLSSKIYTNVNDNYTYGDLSPTILAILEEINKNIKKNNLKISKIRNINLPANTTFEANDTIMIPLDNNNIELCPNVFCKILTDKSTNKEIVESRGHEGNTSRTIEESTITITLTTNKSIETIMNYVNTITNIHNENIKNKRFDTIFIIKPKFNRGMRDGCNEMEYPTYTKFNSNKSFDNLFFEGKEALIKRLDTFVNRDKYKVLGLPETLGILFHGDPGTGKTSAIKAIANYLNRSIIIVPMNNIKTKKRLEEIFFGPAIDIPQEKRIYVFEEIDCNGWENIVRDRRLIKDTSETNNNSEISAIEKLADKLSPLDSKKNKDIEENDKLTLGSILEIIDGLIECPGRIIIMTTNHKEHLDSALLRPGRIDIEIEFKKLRRTHISQIYQKWYGKPLNLCSLNKIPDYKYTQAEISQLLFKYESNSSEFLKEIMDN
jgi:chaperone BCS1